MQYSENSTTHGISYIFEEGQLLIERMLWFLAVVVMIVVAIWFSLQAYINWKVNQLEN